MLHLCDQLGVCIAISPEDWSQLLSAARQHGWQPAGTFRPPVHFDRPGSESDTWDGNYESPEGQIVGRMDAEHLRFALEDAIEADTLHQYSPEWLLPFFGFFRRSFAICADSPEIRAFSGAPDAPQRMPDAVALAYLGHPQSS
jgi:hypothetical protein